MTDLVVLVLVVLWIAVLTPRLVRHFREGRSQDSIDSFHEQLHLLERTGPKLVEPAYRLEASPHGPCPPGLAVLEAAAAPPAQLVSGLRKRQSSWERRRIRRRRRDLLLGLFAVVALTGGLGAMHALHLLWAVTGVTALVLAGYVALVAYAQMLHADRDAIRPVAHGRPVVHDRPVAAGTGDVPAPPSVARERARHAGLAATPPVEVVNGRSAWAARAGYPGAWDDAELVSAGRRATGS